MKSAEDKRERIGSPVEVSDNASTGELLRRTAHLAAHGNAGLTLPPATTPPTV